METVLIRIDNKKAYRFLEDLEDLQVIKVLQKKTETNRKLSEKYAGKLPSEIADDMQKHVTESRNEWKHRITP